jgi:hypothetical protein
LQPGGEVRRFADNRLFLCRSSTDQIADDNRSGGDPDARLKLDGINIKTTDSVAITPDRLAAGSGASLYS